MSMDTPIMRGIFSMGLPQFTILESLVRKVIFAGKECNSGQILIFTLLIKEHFGNFWVSSCFKTLLQWAKSLLVSCNLILHTSAVVVLIVRIISQLQDQPLWQITLKLRPRSYSNIARCNVGLHSSSAEF